MATAMDNAGNVPIGADAKLRVTVETGEQPVSVNTHKDDKSSVSLKGILSSLAETRKYLPDQVYTFLDTMEGKTLDDLRMEAMNLANKAQEEAKKRAGDMTNMGKSMVGNANTKVHDVADKAKQQTTDVANGLVNKGMQVVQPPIASTTAMTKSLAQRAMDNTYNVAEKSLTFTNQRVVPYLTPYLAPVTSRARYYMPEPAKNFLEQNVDGKTIYELRNVALTGARKALLSVETPDDQPTLAKVAGEVKDAATSGALLFNALSLGEKAASTVFGGSEEIPKDAGAIRRMYNLSTKVTGGVRTYANNQINAATQKALDMAAERANAAKSMAYGRVNQVKDTVLPVAERIGATPLVPGFVFRMLRGEQGKSSGLMAKAEASMESEKEKMETPAKVPTTTVRIDIVGMQPSDAPQATVPPSSATATGSASSSAPSTLPTPATKDNAQVNMEGSTASFGGANPSMDLKDMAASSSSDRFGANEGNLGDAGMGVTMTGSEAPTSAKGLDDPNSSQVGKKAKKQQNKL